MLRAGDAVTVGVSADTSHLFDADGLAFSRSERNPMADLARDRDAMH